MAVYFAGLAEHEGAPAHQVGSALVFGEWYRLKVRAASPGLRADDKDLQREMAPWFDAMKKDPATAADEFAACSRRAAADPSFESFVRALPN
jgi:hypothetical protein